MTTPTSASLPNRPSLALLSNLAKQLQKSHSAKQREAISRIQSHHPRFASATAEQIGAIDLSLRDAQLVIAREYGFEHWAALKKHVLSLQDAGSKDLIDALIESARKGDLAKVKSFLDEHPDLLNARGGGSRMQTALHVAAEGENLALVEHLLNRGADPTIRDVGDNATALHYAAEHGQLEICKRLVEFGSDVDGFGDIHGWEMMGWATIGDRTKPEVARYLLECGAKHNIFSAVALGDVDAIKEAAKNPDAIDKPMNIWEERRRPLHLAIIKKQPNALATLLELGANTELTNIDDLTPLDQAALRGDTQCVRFLLDHRAVIHLPAAFGLRRKDLIEQYMKDDPDCLKPGGTWERLLMLASAGASGEVIEDLLARGAPVNMRVDARWSGVKNYTPLHDAAWNGNLEAIRVLVKHGADLEAEDDTYHGTPLGWARHNNQTAAVELLKSHGAKT